MLSDPIAALATPPGRSALAVIRVSGRGALDIASKIIRRFRPGPARRASLATSQDLDGTPLDRGISAFYPAPQSYPGEDLIELSCHGGLIAPTRILAAL